MLEVSGPADWSGVYAGGQWGLSNAGMDFSGASDGMISPLLANDVGGAVGSSGWSFLGKGNSSGTAFGAFVGYNFQWEDAVVGIEANYNRTSLTSHTSGSDGRATIVVVDSTTTPVTRWRYSGDVNGAASLTLTDYGTFRLRGGYAMGRFMPYGFVAAAIGRVNYSHSASFIGTVTDISAGSTLLATFTPSTSGNEGTLVYGGAVGLGLEMLLTNNLFVRAEWEYVQFQHLHNVTLNINSVRAGAGVKF